MGWWFIPLFLAVLLTPQENPLDPGARVIVAPGCGTDPPMIWCSIPRIGQTWELASDVRFPPGPRHKLELPMGWWSLNAGPLTSTCDRLFGIQSSTLIIPAGGAVAIGPALRYGIQYRLWLPEMPAMVGAQLWLRLTVQRTWMITGWDYSWVIKVTVGLNR
jgi:hypothetical protein